MLVTAGATLQGAHRAHTGDNRRPRVLLYSHDTFGLGHLRRCLKLAQALKELCSDASILLLTGSPYADRYQMPEGVTFVKLPSVVKTGPDQYEPRSPAMSLEDVLSLRRILIFEASKAFGPHLVLVDHAPMGMKGELVPMLTWMKQNRPGTRLLLGLRDIIDSPEAVRRAWQENRVQDFIDSVYDQVLVYGAPQVFDPIAAYEFQDSLRHKTSFVGYIGDPARTSRHRLIPSGTKKEIFLTVGGGEDGVDIVSTYLSMLRHYGAGLGAKTTVVTGPYFPEQVRESLRSLAGPLDVRIHEFLPDISGHLQRADLVVSMGGHNSVAEILSNARRALIIPRAYPREEQLLRAQRLSQMGLVDYIPAADLSETRMYEHISALLASDEQPLIEARLNQLVPLNGAAQTAAVCQAHLDARLGVNAWAR